MPLLLAQRSQAREIEALRRDVATLRAELAEARSATGAGMASPAPAPGARAMILLAGWLGALLALIGLHWLLIIRLDASTAMLRAVAIAVPLTVATLLPGLGRLAATWIAALGALLGLSAVLAMSFSVALQDGTSVLPTSRRDLLEMLEFAASIALAFLAGGLIRKAGNRLRAAAQQHATMATIRDLLAGKGGDGLDGHAQRLKKLAEAAAPLAAFGGSLVTGFRVIIGGD